MAKKKQTKRVRHRRSLRRTTWAFVEWNQRWLDSLELTSAAASSQCSFILLFLFFYFLSLFYLVVGIRVHVRLSLRIPSHPTERRETRRCSLCRTIANSRCRRACEISTRSTLLLKPNPQFPWRFSLPDQMTPWLPPFLLQLRSC